MLARIRKATEEKDEGFTLIELLVVIIIIGILAAIAIPTFLNQRKKGWDSASKAEVKSVYTAQESYATENDGAYTAALADLTAQGYNQSDPFKAPGTLTVTLSPSVAGGANDQFCVQVSHKSQATVFWKLSNFGANAGAPVKGTC